MRDIRESGGRVAVEVVVALASLGWLVAAAISG